jgi:putative methyltransferase (TIGR04325 family)
MWKRTAFAHLKGTCNLLLYYTGLRGARFRGVYSSHEQALTSVRPGRLAGYDHDQLALVSFERMCRVSHWDWPVLYWLKRLEPQIRCLLDAGGHMGTKYRAFHNHLNLDKGLQWVVYDLPAIVRAGRKLAASDGLHGLSFVDDISAAPKADVVLVSGLLQYLDQPFGEFMRKLPELPEHLLLNKVAVRNGPTIVTLENFVCAEVPYQIRNCEEFLASLNALGYEIMDTWELPDLSHVITTHPYIGASTSLGFYARLIGSSSHEDNPG